MKYSNAIILTTPINTANDVFQEKEDNTPVEKHTNVPSEKSQELYDEYINFGNVTCLLSDYLRKEGFATQVLHPAEEVISLSKLGQDAGLGYIGKNGLLITPELGPRLKVSAILSTIENLDYSQKNSHEWIESYCKTCDKCIKGCPENALVEKDDKSAKATYIKEKCLIGCSEGCTCCITCCPFFEKRYSWVKHNKLN